MRDLLARKIGVQSTGKSGGIISATGINDLLGRLDQLERKDKMIGIVASSSIAIVVLITLLFWFANAGLVMGIDEPEWKTIGLISPGADYGINELGQKDINNFQAPSPNANGEDRPPSPLASNNASASNNNPTPSNAQSAPGVITGTDETSPIAANSGQESTKPNPNASANATGNSKPTPTPGNTIGGGSNDGNTNQVGNTGNRNATVLNDNGLFTYGNGIGGAGGRKPIRTGLKGYNVQLEEKIKFEITIDPEGDVIFVKAPFAVHQELVAIGKKSIMEWKFSETDASAGNLKTSVMIAFRLQ